MFDRYSNLDVQVWAPDLYRAANTLQWRINFPGRLFTPMIKT